MPVGKVGGGKIILRTSIVRNARWQIGKFVFGYLGRSCNYILIKIPFFF